MSDLSRKEHPKWNAAAMALLTERTKEKAAKRAGIGASTLRRWLSDPDFRRFCRDTRIQSLEHAVNRVAEVTVQAVDVLKANLNHENPSIQVRSAIAIIDIAFKGADALEIEERLSRLEEISKGGQL